MKGFFRFEVLQATLTETYLEDFKVRDTLIELRSRNGAFEIR